MPAERAARVLGTRGILGLAPSTVVYRTPKGYETFRPGGVEIRYAAPQGVTAAWFQRQLECHQADVALGRVAARDDDPFVLPDAWLSLDVRAVGSTLVVRVSTDDRNAAGALVERAQRLQRAQAQ